ncbi:unnamed protein product, partial [marine sediment metagenome]
LKGAKTKDNWIDSYSNHFLPYLRKNCLNKGISIKRSYVI